MKGAKKLVLVGIHAKKYHSKIKVECQFKNFFKQKTPLLTIHVRTQIDRSFFFSAESLKFPNVIHGFVFQMLKD